MTLPPVRYPVAAPSVGSLEEAYVLDAVRSGWVSSIGEYVSRFEARVAAISGVTGAVAVSNGTDALSVTLAALEVGTRPGDEVIVPALTFAAVPAVVRHQGAIPVLVDISADHWCMDPRAVERAMTERTRAIVAVHSYGHPADMEAIGAIAEAKGIPVIEDCAEAHGASIDGRLVGSWGKAGCFSFYGNKIVSCGEGGAVVGDDEEFLARVRYLKDHAQDAGRHYFHSAAGYNARMTNLQAALGCAQVERLDELLAFKARLLHTYRETWGERGGLRLNPKAQWAEPVVWLVSAVLDRGGVSERETIRSKLREEGIDTRPFFVPLRRLPPYQDCPVVGVEGEGAPVADIVGDRGLNLPSGYDLTDAGVEEIATTLARICDGI